MTIDTVKWDIEPHTQAKHEVLRRYLGAWFPILSQNNKRIIYLDGFAGPGEYSGGEDGSPIIALNEAINHKANLTSEIIFVFIEKDKKRCENLKQVLSKIELPSNIKCDTINGLFDETLTENLTSLEEQGKNLAPTFVFIDPFGISQTPFSIIERIMKNKRCEILVTFMYNSIDRCVTDHPDVCSSLFGGEEWKEIAKITDTSKRLQAYHDYYRKQLEEVAKIKYVRSFKMRNKFNNEIYCLFFGTNHLLGLERMKDAMWKVDNSGRYEFSDSTDPNQTTLFKIDADYGLLEKLILERYLGKQVTIDELEHFVLVETPFKKTGHLKRPILAKMEKENPSRIKVTNRNRAGSYPEGCVIEFLT